LRYVLKSSHRAFEQVLPLVAEDREELATFADPFVVEATNVRHFVLLNNRNLAVLKKSWYGAAVKGITARRCAHWHSSQRGCSRTFPSSSAAA
jgi:hypothetical protein